MDTNPNQKIEKREITTELKEAYLDYAMSVIVARALPDVRDGLKPVQRRILWAMWDSGLTASAKLRKSANVVGEVLGKYHPHGDASVYDAMVRMAQDFSLRYPFVQGQGNFGSIDGDNAAAMRYTEARLSKMAEEMLVDIEKETVDWQPNYDGTREEPKVMPAKLPGLLLNGATGIAVGMATSIPPHNLGEVIDATIHLIEKPEATTHDLTQFVQGPDFPTGAIIYDKKAIAEAYAQGRGSITTRAKAEIIEKKTSGKGQYVIEISEIPYMVNKSELIMKMAELVTEKKIEGIRDIRDESDKNVRIIIELKSDANPQKILNQLYNQTDLQKDFHLNMVALVEAKDKAGNPVGLRPEVLSLKDVLSYYIEHRKSVVRRRAQYDLRKAEERAHILTGLAKALSIIDKVIATIKKSKDREEAHANLIKNFKFSPIQANAILEMRLQTLANLEQKKIEDELAEKQKLIAELNLLLKSPAKILQVIKTELGEMRKNYGDERRTKVMVSGLKDFKAEDLIPQEETIITLSNSGYIKRMQPANFRSQNRGGKGLIGSEVNDDDLLTHIIGANTHDNILFFTEKGRVFRTKVYEIPEGSRTAKGKPIQNFLEIPNDEAVKALIAYSDKGKGSEGYLVMLTQNGVIKKTELTSFENVRRTGIIAISLKGKDLLKWVKHSSGSDDIIITTSQGQAIRFKESQTRPMGRAASGIRAIRLKANDVVSSADLITKENKDARLLVMMANGYGKQTKISEYKTQNRGGSGIRTAKVTAKTGPVVAAQLVTDQEELIAISANGQIIKTTVASVRAAGRSTQGVKVMTLREKDRVAGMICL